MKKLKMMSDKRGLGLNEIFPAVLIVAVVLILMVLLLYVFSQLGATFTAGTAEFNGTNTAKTQITNALPLAGLMLVIVFVGAVIGILITSLLTRGRGRA